MKSLLLVVSSVLLAVAFNSHATESATAAPTDTQINDDAQQKRLDEGVRLLKAGQPAQAIEQCFTKIIAFYEMRNEAKVRLYAARSSAEALLYMLEAAKAKTDAKVVGSSYAYAYFLKGYALTEMRRVDEAKAAIAQAIEISPHNSQFLSEQAVQLASSGEWAQSLLVYQRAELAAREFSPDTSKKLEIGRALRGQGYALVELHRLAEAQKIYQSCLDLDPNDKKAAAELAYVRERMTQAHP